MTVKPFIKWAGGKGQLLTEIRKRYPVGLKNNIKKYCEPFVGGGAVLFDILSNYSIEEILINDVNNELINTYRQIIENLKELVNELKKIEENYIILENEERKLYYYKKRERFNYLKLNGNEKTNIEKAVLFIFLNKTCFNGLFRVNKKGNFNVPMGSYKKPLICDEENLIKISKLLKNVKIRNGSYEECISFIDEKTFVYIDPPYRPLTATASFTSYTENNFNDEEQIRLKKFIDTITSKKGKVLLSNSDPKNSNDDDNFFDDLYNKYKIERVYAKRFINSKAGNRGDITELLISNYKE
ncbi:MAG: DNA adenine methylase [Fusobacterium sp.]|uniref:DNA adenine methylase n=1 Tax=Fusobacterium sp. TaxID=68766 RepID=UPI0026DCEEB4|nr:DNA adenine methylase [Fusobacterium sp.]MDO4690780.1 DNA adenine methylase [Fusobacterium sp.]